MDTCIEEAFEQTQQAVIKQQKYEDDMRAKEQSEIDNYFSAIKLKKQINASHSGSQAQNIKSQSVADSASVANISNSNTAK